MINDRSQILQLDPSYFDRVVADKNLKLEKVGDLCKIHGYNAYNYLIDINTLFSASPSGEPTDRTGNVRTPVKIYAGRSFETRDQIIDIEQACASRVTDLELQNKMINVMWSGGIDSTAVVTAMLKHLRDLSQLRVIYSPYSTYEHPDYLEFLKRFNVEIVDMSGTVYLDTFFDGFFVTGDGGDESHASIDDSFFQAQGFSGLVRPWRDFFWQHKPDQEFMDFCEQYFSRAGQEISTVLEARWWFYINSKYRCILNRKLHFWIDYPGFDMNLVVGFFDCDQFECYIRHNLDRIIRPAGYHTWKQDLKDYCTKLDGFDHWAQTKSKVMSSQITLYAAKKRAMKDLHSLYVLTDGQIIRTPNMPLFSIRELYALYGNSLDHLWNAPDKI